MTCQIIVLAAGNGHRMNSDLPKVMHQVGGKAMIERVLANAQRVTDDIILVHSAQLEPYIVSYRDICKFILQPRPLGTADAVYEALELVDDKKIIAVLYGDNPLITPEIINELLDHLATTNSSVATLCFERENPAEYGRIITDPSGNFIKIVEFREATNEEKAIKICNSGIMAFKPAILRKYLPLVLQQHPDQLTEVYLTAIVEVAKTKGEQVSYLLSQADNLVLGVNTMQELEDANKTIAHFETLLN
ncbi:NTP transferase domain-containing protein [Candidatus Tisiphia endosymbiont of Nemotelus uliginosus]|uniref:NTP transferase domain-containing protein n=1 Tax=Candidatus Tisiphia endosymbiont of Nemotelus uliginosus TaxID=3077926 RepID=UPI0035C8FF26